MFSALMKFFFISPMASGADFDTRSAMACTSSRKVVSGNVFQHQADAFRLVGAELLRHEEQLSRLGRANDARQQPRTGHVAGDRHTEERRVEHRPLAGIAQVAGAGPAEAGTGAGTVYGGDGDLGHLVKQRRDVEILAPIRFLIDTTGGCLQVDAGAEATPGAREQHRAHLLVERDDVQALVEFPHHRVGDAV